MSGLRVKTVRPGLVAALVLVLMLWAGVATAAVSDHVIACADDPVISSCGYQQSNNRYVEPAILSGSAWVWTCPAFYSVSCGSAGSFRQVSSLVEADWIASVNVWGSYGDTGHLSDFTFGSSGSSSGGSSSGSSGTLEIDVLPTLTPEQGAQIAGAIAALWAIAWAVRHIRDALLES